MQDINNFLGLDADKFETEGFRPGILLSMLCIFLWSLGDSISEFKFVTGSSGSFFPSRS